MPKPTLQVPAKRNEPDYSEKMASARIPLIYRERMLSDDARFSILYDYVTGDAYPADYENSNSICVVGSYHLTVEAFPLLARSFVVKNDSVMYVCLYDLYLALSGDGDKVLAACQDADIVFIEGFYDEQHDFPFTASERYRIENFLTHRVKRGQRNAYQTPVRFSEVGRWWTASFIAHQDKKLRTLSL